MLLCSCSSLSGTFVSRLGIDLTLGSLIGLGVQFGVAAEAIQMAGVLTFPQTPWILSNPMTHKPKSFNSKLNRGASPSDSRLSCLVVSQCTNDFRPRRIRFPEMVKQTFVSQCDYDGGLLSEPFAIMNMLFDYERKEKHQLKSFVVTHGLHSARVRRLSTTCGNLRKRYVHIGVLQTCILQAIAP